MGLYRRLRENNEDVFESLKSTSFSLLRNMMLT